MNADCCEKCRFWRQPGMPANPGECHRRAPLMQITSHWPAVNRGDWCGEFEMRHGLEPCAECGKPSGVDGVQKMEHNAIIGRFCKACSEKVNPASIGPFSQMMVDEGAKFEHSVVREYLETKEKKPANHCVECGKETNPELGYVPFYYGGGKLKFIHQTCANERFKRGEKIYQ